MHSIPWPEDAERLAERFWPGPLSLVLPKLPTVPDIVTAGMTTVAVRIPAHPLALALLRAAGVPVAAPSANRSNHLSPTTAAHVRASLGDAVDIILDGGPTSGGLESTVLDLSRRPPRLLRPGLVPPSSIEALIGPIEQPSLSLADTTPLPSPGTQPRHYAPRAVMECRAEGSRERIAALVAEGVRVGWLALGVPANNWPANVKLIAMPTDPEAYAARLYAALHELDDAGVERIVVDLPPDEERWLAVRDRLRRGSAPLV
jgi:L-threonylcarbamoyladenylate synthase